MNSSDLVVGVDGGNSKTDVAVADLTGNVLGRSRGAGTLSPIAGGAEALAAHLMTLIDDAKRRSSHTDQPAAAVFYLANLDLPDEEQVLSEALIPLGIARQVAVGNDALAILRAGTDEGWGVAVVLGTGINAIGISPDGQTERFLGIGAVAGDWGGGRALAVAGIGAAVRHGDGRGRPTSLTVSLPSHFGFSSSSELAIAIQRGIISPDQVLQLTKLVLAAADAGDPASEAIIVRQGDEVADMVLALLRRLNRLDEVTPVILGGGVAQSGNRLLLATIEKRLADAAPGASVRVLTLPPVAGALAAALDLAGAGRPAIHTVRMYDWTVGGHSQR